MLFNVWGGGITYLSDIYIKQGNLSGVKACGCYIKQYGTAVGEKDFYCINVLTSADMISVPITSFA